MKILQLTQDSNGQSGLSNTASEIGEALGRLGHDVRTCSPDHSSVVDEARGADRVLCHGDLGNHLSGIDVPIIKVLHGTPEYMFNLEAYRRSWGWSQMRRSLFDPRIMAYVTLWPSHVQLWNSYLGPARSKLVCLAAGIDTGYWNKDAKIDQQVVDAMGDGPHVVVADRWREDSTPLGMILYLADVVAKDGSKLHVLGIQEMTTAHQTLVGILAEKDVLGLVGYAKDMRSVYLNADEVITHRPIATRVVREATACGAWVRRYIPGPHPYLAPMTWDVQCVTETAESILSIMNQ